MRGASGTHCSTPAVLAMPKVRVGRGIQHAVIFRQAGLGVGDIVHEQRQIDILCRRY